MDEFEKWLGKHCALLAGESLIESIKNSEGTLRLWSDRTLRAAWQESAKQKDAEIDGLNTIIENLEMSVKSFTDGNG